MGETLQPVTASFNRSLRIESRVERLTGDPGAVLVRDPGTERHRGLNGRPPEGPAQSGGRDP